jgi:membrane fusion protein (multidrug efflux system)
MAKRMLLTLGVTLAVIAALGFVKFRQVKQAMAVYADYQPPPEAVTTAVVARARWPKTLTAVGTVAAFRGVTVSADLPGVVEKIAFASGQAVHEGDVLVELDSREEQAQLTAAIAQRDLMRVNRDRMRNLRDQRVVSPAEYDQANASADSAAARVGELTATISRKAVRAPFSGELGLRQVNLGQYLAGGTPIVSLQALDPIFVNFAVPQQNAGALRVGTHVHATVSGNATDVEGRVTALDAVVDPATRNVEIQATFRNADGRLHPGMFAEVAATLGSPSDVVVLPASAIDHAPYGDSVFVVEREDTPKGSRRVARQRFVTLGAARGDQVAIERGVRAGEEVVTSGLFKLRNNAAVLVNNAAQPSNSLHPSVEDR